MPFVAEGRHLHFLSLGGAVCTIPVWPPACRKATNRQGDFTSKYLNSHGHEFVAAFAACRQVGLEIRCQAESIFFVLINDFLAAPIKIEC